MCQSCHPEIYETYKQTGMGRSLYSPDGESDIEDYVKNTVVHDSKSGYYYRMYKDRGRYFQKEYRLENGFETHALTREVKYVIGSGNHVRSYITDINGFVYEMPVSWYSEKKKWDLSPGYQKRNQRFSRVILQECMGCHNSYVTFFPGSTNRYEFPFEEGISCERCHGPGENHVNYRLRQKAADRTATKGRIDSTIVNPSRLDRQAQMDVCQQCHLPGIMQVAKPGRNDFDFRPGMRLSEIKSVYGADGHASDQFGIASHPERLGRSVCFQQSGTMTCVTCHNPHVTVYQTPREAFNNRCQSCHPPGNLAQSRMAFNHANQDDCVRCHMKQGGTSDIPHVVFTDHWIRRRPGDAAQTTMFSIMEPSSVDTLPVSLTDLFRETDSLADVRLGIAYFKYFWNKRRDGIYLERARSLLMRETIENPSSADGQYYLGLVHHTAGEYDSAIRSFQAVLSTDASYLKARFWLADCHMALARYDTAISLLMEEEALMPHDPQIHLKMGNALLQTDRVGEAVGEYQKALDLNPTFVDARMNLGLVLYTRMESYSEAELQYRRVIELDPLNAEAHFNLGNVLYSLHRPADAARSYVKAIDINSGIVGAFVNAIIVYGDMNDRTKALEYLKRGLERHPGHPSLLQLKKRHIGL